jgi:hypothetical protein
VQGFQSVVNHGTTVQFEYQGINESRYFNVANLHNYNLILSTPFMFQHEVLIGLNECQVVIGSDVSKPIEGLNVNKLHSRAIEAVEEDLDKVQAHIMKYAEQAGLFADTASAPLPPMCAINHSIHLIDENLVIP